MSLKSKALFNCAFAILILSCGTVLPQSSQAETPVLGDLTGSWQLFVDDYLIDNKDNLTRTYHQFQKSSANPVLEGDQSWEGNSAFLYGTVLPNENSSGYRMWYHSWRDGYQDLYATSEDGINWVKPNLGLYEADGSINNNLFMPRGRDFHIPQIIHTPWETDPDSQYKFVGFSYNQGGYVGATSPDGIHWNNSAANPILPNYGDVGCFVWDPHKN